MKKKWEFIMVVGASRNLYKYISILFVGLIITSIYFTYEIEDPSIEIEKKLKVIATKEYLEKEILNSLNQENIEDSIIYKDLATYLNIDLSNDIREKIKEKSSFFNTSVRNTKDFSESFITGQGDNLAGLAGSTVSDMLVIGDIRDLSTEGTKFAADEEYDAFVLGVAAIGVGLTISEIVTAGSTSSLKVGTSLLKFAKKTKNLTKNFLSNTSTLLSKSIDFSKLKSVNFKDIDNLKSNFSVFAKTIDFKHIKELFENVSSISKNTESKINTVKLLKYVESPKDLQKLNKISSKFGKNTIGVFKVLGDDIIKAGGFIIKFTFMLIIQLISLGIGMIIFIFSFTSSSIFLKRIFIRNN